MNRICNVFAAYHAAPRQRLAAEPQPACRLKRQAVTAKILICRIAHVDSGHHGIHAYGEGQRAFLSLSRFQLTADHTEVYLSGQCVSDALAGTAGTDVYRHAGMHALELGAPSDGKRIKRERTRQRYMAFQS